MSFICVICRDLLKISEDQEEASPRHHRHHQQQQLLPNNGQSTTITANHQHNVSTTSSCINNMSGGRRNKGKNNSIVATKCGHLFHYPCLSVWLSQSMNLTTDSKMRCPSCKSLIYIYELIQLFPVETASSNNNDDLEQLFSSAFQQKLKVMLDHLDRLCRELSSSGGGSKKNNEMAIGSPLKGNETPTRLQRVRDSPKKSHTTQLAQLTKEMDSLRGSIRELNSFIEQHAELGSVVERQTREISELRSKNEQLILANERWKSIEANPEEEEQDEKKEQEEASADKKIVPTSPSNNNNNNNATEDSSLVLLQEQRDKKECHQATQAATTTGTAASEIFMRTAQDSRKYSKEGHLMSNQCSKVSNATESTTRRKSVTFLDPFEEFDENEMNVKVTKANIPFETKDFRVGDKVVWRFEGNLEIGTVKWKGFIGSQINVGVEFERQLGLPIKDLSSDALQCIFKCKPGHGRLIPVQEVVLYNKEIMKNSNHSTAAYQCDGCNTSQTNGMINKRIQSCTHQ